MDIAVQALIIWALIGLVAGWLASLVLGGKGLIRYLLAGVIGSVVGGWLLGILGIAIPIDNFWIREIAVAFVGALIVIVVARLIAR
jgi:uncharacterized membrane protein YeaQ/YmgE (transglycosylase-associated protein family)